MSQSGFDYGERRYIPIGETTAQTLAVRQGDLFVSRGNGSLHLLGRSTLAQEPPELIVFPDTMIRLRLAGVGRLRRFVHLLWPSRIVRSQIEKKARTTAGIYKISQRDIGAFCLPIPPLNEQIRIVAKIDELFSDLDAGVAALKRAKANLKRYRAAVLKAAVEGKLTEQWRAEHPATEPASKLLECILAGRRKKWEVDQLAKYAAAGKTPPKDWRVKYVEPAGTDTAGLPALPEGWCWASVDQIAEVQGGIQKQPKRKPQNNGYPFLRVANVLRGRLDLGEVHRIELFNGELEKLRLRRGDLLVVEGNGSRTEIGRSAIWNGTIDDCVHQNHIIRVRLLGGSPEYLNSYWNSPNGTRRVSEVAASTSGLYTLSVGKIASLPVPLAPALEQEKIVVEIDQRLSVVDKVGSQIEADLRRAARLRQGILKRAFEGRLVAQNPTDEPASVLLARIRESREAERRIHPARAARKLPAASGGRRKQPAGNIFRRGAVVCYVIRTLKDRPSFGRTQLAKVLHLTQAHLGVDLGLEFERWTAGPFDKTIYKLEGFAKKQGWFNKEDRPSFGVRYQPGPNIGERCEAAVAILGEKRAAVDELLAHVAGMDADAAELFATVYAAWNDLLIDGNAASEEAIIAEVYGWDESKKRFPEARITRCIAWMRKHGYIPTGTGQRTQLRPPVSEKKTRRRRKKP